MDLYNLVVSAKLSKGGGGDEPVLIDKSITENGTYKASNDNADGYKKVTVCVPSSGITPSGTSTITANGIYDVTNFASASVNVPASGITPTGTSSITVNGIYDITSFASVDVNVSGGGGGEFTADEIAMRTISGVASGSASFIGNNAFYNCSALAIASFPSATSIGNSAFYNCSALTTVSFPNVTSIGNNVFYNCSALAIASFPSATSIGNNAFQSCSALTTAIFLGSSMATLGANAFANTPMSKSTYTGSFGSIYVPASLVDSYKTKVNWSAYASRITAYVE